MFLEKLLLPSPGLEEQTTSYYIQKHNNLNITHVTWFVLYVVDDPLHLICV